MNENTRNLAMLFGLAGFAGGILLMIYHRRQWLEVLRAERHLAAVLFETRKFRRRALLAALIAACGSGLSAMYWARDPRILAGITGIVLILLLCILALAVWDALHVAFYRLGQNDRAAQRDLIRKYHELKNRQDPPPDPP